MVQRRKKSVAGFRRPGTPRQAGARRGELDELLEQELLKALGDPIRARLLACVAKCGRSCSVGEVAGCCHLDLSTVSRHLKILARAGVMESSKRGTSVLYAVRYEHLVNTFRRLSVAIDAWRPRESGALRGGGCDGCG